jgi:hypothetical protein
VMNSSRRDFCVLKSGWQKSRRRQQQLVRPFLHRKGSHSSSTSSMVTEGRFFALDPRFWRRDIADFDLRGMAIVSDIAGELQSQFHSFLHPVARYLSLSALAFRSRAWLHQRTNPPSSKTWNVGNRTEMRLGAWNTAKKKTFFNDLTTCSILHIFKI